MNNKLSILLLKNGENWVAQCLQLDIAAQAPTIKDVVYQFERNLISELVVCEEKGLDPFQAIPPAPRYFWKRFDRKTGWEPVGPRLLGYWKAPTKVSP